MTNQSVDLNHNIADCLIHKNHLGYTEITNICTDVVSRVNWSVFDYIGGFTLSLICFAIIMAFFGLFLMMFIGFTR